MIDRKKLEAELRRVYLFMAFEIHNYWLDRYREREILIPMFLTKLALKFMKSEIYKDLFRFERVWRTKPNGTFEHKFGVMLVCRRSNVQDRERRLASATSRNTDRQNGYLHTQSHMSPEVAETLRQLSRE